MHRGAARRPRRRPRPRRRIARWSSMTVSQKRGRRRRPRTNRVVSTPNTGRSPPRSSSGLPAASTSSVWNRWLHSCIGRARRRAGRPGWRAPPRAASGVARSAASPAAGHLDAGRAPRAAARPRARRSSPAGRDRPRGGRRSARALGCTTKVPPDTPRVVVTRCWLESTRSASRTVERRHAVRARESSGSTGSRSPGCSSPARICARRASASSSYAGRAAGRSRRGPRLAQLEAEPVGSGDHARELRARRRCRAPARACAALPRRRGSRSSAAPRSSDSSTGIVPPATQRHHGHVGAGLVVVGQQLEARRGGRRAGEHAHRQRRRPRQPHERRDRRLGDREPAAQVEPDDVGPPRGRRRRGRRRAHTALCSSECSRSGSASSRLGSRWAISTNTHGTPSGPVAWPCRRWIGPEVVVGERADVGPGLAR